MPPAYHAVSENPLENRADSTCLFSATYKAATSRYLGQIGCSNASGGSRMTRSAKPQSSGFLKNRTETPRQTQTGIPVEAVRFQAESLGSGTGPFARGRAYFFF